MENLNLELLEPSIGAPPVTYPQVFAAPGAVLDEKAVGDGALGVSINAEASDAPRGFPPHKVIQSARLKAALWKFSLHPVRVVRTARAPRFRRRAARRTTARLALARPGDDDPPLSPAAEQLTDRIASRIQAQRRTVATQRLVVAYLVVVAVIEITTLVAGLVH